MSEEIKETMDDYKEEIDKSFKKISAGDLLTGTIVAINEDEASVDLGTYSQGVLPKDEASNDPAFNIMRDLVEGDQLTFAVVSVSDGQGRIVLSKKKADDILAWDKLDQIFTDQQTLELKVSGVVKGGVVTYVEGIRGFIPASQLSTKYVEDLNTYLGKTIEARIITLDKAKKKLVLSSRVVEQEKKAESRQTMIRNIVPGTVFEGNVDKIMPFGAFVKLDNGLSGLVHISQVSVKRINSVGEVLKEGDRVKVKVLKVENGKISLSIKALAEGDEVTEAEEPVFNYKEEGRASTSLASLLSGIKLDQ